MGEQPSALTRFVGAAMMAVGVLITLLSGACTGVMVFINLSSIGKGANHSVFLTIFGVGLPFIAIGIALVAGGRSISRQREPRAPSGDG